MPLFSRKFHRVWCAALLLAVLLAAFPLTAFAAESGSCGNGLSWHYAAGTLTISGEGAMNDYSDGNLPPWYHLRGEITRLVLSDGLTSVGQLAFYECTMLQSVSMPDSVRLIRDKAFAECSRLRFVDLSDQLLRIGDRAFYGCRKLETLTLPSSLNEIGEKAFYLCESLTAVTIPRYVETLGAEMFAYCSALVRVRIEARVSTIPEWAFYGCGSLVEVELPPTVCAIETFAFKKCEELTSVYCGDATNAQTVRQELSEDLPQFASGGFVGGGLLTEVTDSTETQTDEAGNVQVLVNSTVRETEGMQLTTVVTTVTPEAVDVPEPAAPVITLTVEDNEVWAEAQAAVVQTLTEMGDAETVELQVYLEQDVAMDTSFVQSLVGRDLQTEVLAADGSVWRLDCAELKANEVGETLNYAHSVGEATEEDKTGLGTDACYTVQFTDSAEMKSEVLIALPVPQGNNAFLYQKETDGSYTRLQAVSVDETGNAHFYLASVDKETDYVIGINVPGESTDDVILADRATQNAIMRLEKIEYVETGVRELHGFTATQIMLFAIVILVIAAIVIGVVMYMLNKQKMEKMRRAAS